MIRPNSEIRRKATAAALALTAVAATPAVALAVDVINKDAASREIIVNDDSGESKTLTLAPHQKVTGICDSCVVVFGRESVEASQHDVVKISGGKISVGPK